MPKMNVSLPHALSSAEALKRAKTFLSELKLEHGDKISDLQESWSDTGCSFSFEIFSFSVSGTMAVNEREVVVDGTIPYLASLWKGRIEEAIRAKAREVLQ